MIFGKGNASRPRKWAISSALALVAGLIPNLVVPAVASNCVVTLQNATFTASAAPSGLCMVRVSASSGGAQFQVPAGVTSLAVVVIGGGGGGGAGKGNSWGGGGGGGAGQLSVNPQLEVTPGQAVALTVGTGGNGGRSFGNDPIASGVNGTASMFGTVSVAGGIGGLTNASCAGGNGGGPSVTTVNGAPSTFNAGSGASRSCNPGGGGGGGAGSGGAGSAGSGTTEGAGGVGFVEQFSGNQIVLGVGGQGGNSNRNIERHNLSSVVMASPGGGGTGSDGGVNAVARGAPGAPGQIIIFFSPVLSVTYSANGGTGTAPVDSNTYAVGGSATILSAGSLSRDGYEFVEWTTAASGGSAFSSGATVTLAGSLSLFARWSTRSFTVDYDPAAGGEHQGAIPSQVTALFSSLHTVQSTNLTRPGYQLQGWVVAGGNQNQLLTASNTVVLGAAPLVFSAIWAANHYTISFQVEGGSLISPSSYQMGAPIASPSQSSRAGFVFGGWALSANGQPISFPFTRGTPGDFELFALWSVAPEAPASSPQPVSSYRGPTLSMPPLVRVVSGGVITLSGEKLDLVLQATTDGISHEILAQNPASLTLQISANTTLGPRDLELKSVHGRVTMIHALEITQLQLSESAQLPPVLEPAPESAKITVGSFNGSLAIYTKGHSENRISIKAGNRWVKIDARPLDFQRFIHRSSVGASVGVSVFVNGVRAKQVTSLIR